MKKNKQEQPTSEISVALTHPHAEEKHAGPLSWEQAMMVPTEPKFCVTEVMTQIPELSSDQNQDPSMVHGRRSCLVKNKTMESFLVLRTEACVTKDVGPVTV